MKKILFIITFVFISLFITNNSYSQTEKNKSKEDVFLIGYADIESIYLFHPMMKYYDENYNLFIKPLNAKDKNEFLKLINDKTKEFTAAKEANSSEIKRLKSEIENLTAAAQKILKRKNTETALLNENYNRDILNIKNENERKQLTQKLYKDMETLEEKFNKETAANETKLNELKKEYSKIQLKLLNIFYYQPEENEKIFVKINNEIKEAINYAAGKNGVKAVINSSRGRQNQENNMAASTQPVQQEKDNSTFNYEKLEDIISKLPDYSKALTMFDISADGVNGKNTTPQTADQNQNEQYKEKMAEITKESYARSHESNFAKKANIAAAARKYMITDAVITGGVDLTATSVIYLLSRYNIPRPVAEIIHEVINKK